MSRKTTIWLSFECEKINQELFSKLVGNRHESALLTKGRDNCQLQTFALVVKEFKHS